MLGKPSFATEFLEFYILFSKECIVFWARETKEWQINTSDSAFWTLLIPAKTFPSIPNHKWTFTILSMTQNHQGGLVSMQWSVIVTEAKNYQFLMLVFFLTLCVMFWFNCSSLTSEHVSWFFHLHGEQELLFPFACLLQISFSKGTISGDSVQIIVVKFPLERLHIQDL